MLGFGRKSSAEQTFGLDEAPVKDLLLDALNIAQNQRMSR